MQILPAVLEYDFEAVKEKVNLSKSLGLNMVHLDVMDGKFVNNTCFSDHELAKELDIDLEVHLMVNNPLQWAEKWKNLENAKRIIVHREAVSDKELGEINGKIGIALNPETPLESISKYLDKINHVLFMGVTPGWSGQTFQMIVLDKIKELSLSRPAGVTIGVDGGINKDISLLVRDAGAEIINAASFLWKGETKNNLEWLKSL